MFAGLSRVHQWLVNSSHEGQKCRERAIVMMTSSNGNIFRVTGNSPVTGALMFSLICAWINNWVKNREADDLRRHRGHYDVTVIENQWDAIYWCKHHHYKDLFCKGWQIRKIVCLGDFIIFIVIFLLVIFIGTGHWTLDIYFNMEFVICFCYNFVNSTRGFRLYICFNTHYLHRIYRMIN